MTRSTSGHTSEVPTNTGTETMATLSKYGKDSRLNPQATPENPDFKTPDPDLGSGVFDDMDMYHSREYLHKEWDRLWSKTWNMAGRVSDLADPGDWFKFDLGPESFIVTRDETGEIRAYYNVCHHRGSQIVWEDFGKAKQFVCRFHSWAWGLDGKLEQITDEETFDASLVCDRPKLTEVRCETWGGWVFINLDDNPPPLTDYLDRLVSDLSAYRFEDMMVIADLSVTWPLNWKIALDAFMEGYHAHIRHPEVVRYIDDYHFQQDLYPFGQSRMIIPMGLKSPRFADQNSITEELRTLISETGMDPAAYENRQQDIKPDYIRARRSWAENFGLDYSRFTDSQVVDDWNYHMFPNITLNIHPEGVLVMRFRPHADDPALCYYDIMVLAHQNPDPNYRLPQYMNAPDADLSGNAGRPARVYQEHADRGLGLVLNQDADQLPLVQLGTRSKAFKGLRLSQQEVRLRHFYSEYLRYVEGGEDG